MNLIGDIKMKESVIVDGKPQDILDVYENKWLNTYNVRRKDTFDKGAFTFEMVIKELLGVKIDTKCLNPELMESANSVLDHFSVWKHINSKVCVVSHTYVGEFEHIENIESLRTLCDFFKFHLRVNRFKSWWNPECQVIEIWLNKRIEKICRRN